MIRLAEQAKKHLQGQWGTAIIAVLIVNFVTSGPNLLIQLVPSTSYELLLLANLFSLTSIFLLPAQIGLARFFLDIQEDLKPGVDQVFYGFKNGRYVRSLGGLLLMNVFVFLWTLLFIIPGIIKMYAYAMTPYILADPKYDHVPTAETITISRRLMEGHKAELFGIQLFYTWWLIVTIPIAAVLIAFGSFAELGYAILAITIVVLTFYISPLLQQITAEFYRSLSKKQVPNTLDDPLDQDLSEDLHQLNDPLAWYDDLDSSPDLEEDISPESDEEDDDDNPFYR
jgi:uncharacterized membrane protein